MRRRRTAFVVAALGVAAGPALAVSYGASASVMGLHYELIDLRPDDGIAPSASFLDGGAGTFVTLLNSATDPFGSQHFSRSITVPYGSDSTHGMRPDAGGAASLSFASGVLNLAASGMASFGPGKFDGVMVGAGTEQHGLTVMLSPYTGIRWTGSFALDAWSDRSSHEVPWRQYSYANVSVDGFNADGSDVTFFSGVQAYARALRGPGSASKSGDFSFELANMSAAADMVGATVRAGGYAAVAPIPEPGTYALFAAGLAVVGVVTRRRAGKAG